MANFVLYTKSLNLMRINISDIVISLLLSIVFASCSSDSFKIEGELPDVGNQALRAIYVNEAGVQSINSIVEEGKFTLEGISPNLTVLFLYDKNNNLITKVAVKNGDKLKIKGTVKHKYLIEMKGNNVTEDWNAFRKENHLLYSDEEETAVLDKKISEYIATNGDKTASLLLLLYDYSDLNDTESINNMLNQIKEEHRLANIMKAYAEMNAEISKKQTRSKFNSFEFYNEKDSLVSFMPMQGKLSLMYFWGIDDKSRKDLIIEIDTLYTDYKGKKQLQVADIMLDSDTTRWKRTLRREKKDWTHLWAVGGIMEKSVLDLEIKSTPVFLLLDSVGSQVYRGDSIEAVSKLIKNRLKKVESKDKKNKKTK